MATEQKQRNCARVFHQSAFFNTQASPSGILGNPKKFYPYLTTLLFTVFLDFTSLLNFWIWILFPMPNVIFSTKKALTPCFHTTYVASLAREMFGI